ncbi:hypothetical protein EW146_g2435 [Bondarzewia mesenterica]|uniref:F-box domain-containing protein n=1 Tax=Bondarzewia mesenterica TaxID=1095465 RepID=A0A4S4M0K2_9AGAM|nr:hypothetical protein EW146_g2435 [Bondarzewia mesenterica]
MSLSALPVELLDAVAQNLSKPQLVALSRTTSFLCPIAQRLLYRQVSISPTAHNLDVVLTLAKRPDLARFVRTFSIALDHRSTVFLPFYRALARALSSMTELTSLDLLVDSGASWVLGRSSSNPTYPRLSHFTCSFPFDSLVADFLERTPALEELELDSAPCSSPKPSSPIILAATSLPLLSHFVGPYQAAKIIVPGRPLQSIYIHDGDLTEDEIAWLAQSTGHVAVLGAITTALLVPLLQALARHLPYLAYLRVASPIHASLKNPDTVRASPSLAFQVRTISFALLSGFAQTFYEQVASSLTLMPALTDFELSGMHWGSSQVSDKGASKRIWQSSPLTPVLSPAPDHRDDGFEFSSDFAFFAY